MTLAVNPLVEATSGVRNAIFGFAGTADTCCRPFLNIRQNAQCAVENLSIELSKCKKEKEDWG